MGGVSLFNNFTNNLQIMTINIFIKFGSEEVEGRDGLSGNLEGMGLGKSPEDGMLREMVGI
jgi:hypothetical protein